MQAAEFRDFGEISHLHLVERPEPHATTSTAVVRIEAAAVNPSDVKNVAGLMPQTTLPRVPGRDYAGVVAEGPPEWAGVPVFGSGGDIGFTRDGTHQEYIEVPVASLVRKPEHLSYEAAASLGVTFTTAWIGVVEYARLARGEALAVIGAGGGVGGAAIQIAKHLGARTIAIGRSAFPSDSPAAQMADVRVESMGEDLPVVIRSATGGRGADVVLDAVGGPMIETALKLVAHRGRVVEISGGASRRVSFDLIDFYHNESQLLGVDSLKRDLTASAQILRDLALGFKNGAYQAPVVSRVLPLAAVCQAYELVAGGNSGPVVLAPGMKK
jgi:NADPH:quinone reductase